MYMYNVMYLLLHVFAAAVSLAFVSSWRGCPTTQPSPWTVLPWRWRGTLATQPRSMRSLPAACCPAWRQKASSTLRGWPRTSTHSRRTLEGFATPSTPAASVMHSPLQALTDHNTQCVSHSDELKTQLTAQISEHKQELTRMKQALQVRTFKGTPCLYI